MHSPEIVVVCPNSERRRVLAAALARSGARLVREFGSYPGSDGVPALLEIVSDAIIVEMDSDRSAALELVEKITQSPTTVMVLSSSADPDLLMRCMRAGVREFLAEEKLEATLGEALARAAARRAERPNPQERGGKLLVFWGAKGGAGVTTLASNFAIALHKEAGSKVALVDLNLQLGAVAVMLGISPRFTVLDALRHGDRLDREFVSTLMTEYRPGLSVLAASDDFIPSVPFTNGTLAKALHILREQYPYVVVDAGPSLGPSTEALFAAADLVYVVTQLDVLSLRNAHRFIVNRRGAGQHGIEVVLNRFEPRKLAYDEERITKALGIAPKWKIPNDFTSVLRAQNTGSPMALQNSPVARSIAQMARAACGKPPEHKKKPKFGFLGLV